MSCSKTQSSDASEARTPSPPVSWDGWNELVAMATNWLGPKCSDSVFILMFLLICDCKFGNFHEGFIFKKLHMRRFVKMKSSQIGEITLLFTDTGKSCPCREFSMWQICVLRLFAKIKVSRQFQNLQYCNTTSD